MPDTDEKNFQNEMRQAQIASKNQPSETDPPEDEEAAEEAETMETGEAERAAGQGMVQRRRAAVARTAAKEMAEAKVIQLAGTVQKKGGWAVRFGGGRLISIGLGLGFSLVGLIIGVPLLIIGGALFMIGILGSIVGEATYQFGKSMERKAKKKMKGGGGGAAAAMGAMKEGASRFFQILASVFANIGCSVFGFLAGFFLICVIAVVLVAFFDDLFGGIFSAIADFFS
jgi:hypothetical protein